MPTVVLFRVVLKEGTTPEDLRDFVMLHSMSMSRWADVIEAGAEAPLPTDAT